MPPKLLRVYILMPPKLLRVCIYFYPYNIGNRFHFKYQISDL